MEDAELHWFSFVEAHGGTEYSVDLVDALACIARCGRPEHTVASLDSALHLGILSDLDLGEVFARLPDRLQPLRTRLDARSESGQESVLRVALEDAGLEPELQVEIPGVGRVDMLIDGRLICEADSRTFHDGWDMHVRDRDRDLAAARLGYMSLRPTYSRIMFDTARVVDAVTTLLGSTLPRS